MDDGLTIEKANYENILDTTLDGETAREKEVIPTQNAFRSVRSAAESKGMKINALKTKLLCISDPHRTGRQPISMTAQAIPYSLANPRAASRYWALLLGTGHRCGHT